MRSILPRSKTLRPSDKANETGAIACEAKGELTLDLDELVLRLGVRVVFALATLEGRSESVHVHVSRVDRVR